MAQESEDPETTALIRQREEERLKKMTFYCFTHECLRDYILRYFGNTVPITVKLFQLPLGI